ncbi:MAG: isoprenylcysteine carboxylmethyltransferase family protein [Vicinamibacteria bacterium]
MTASHAHALLIAGWVAWGAPFAPAAFRRRTAATRDRSARWGLLLQGLGYFVVWLGLSRELAPSAARVAGAIALFALAAALSWTAVRALGRHWRVEAGLDADHELVRSGPYRAVRHPIYTSMLCMLVATGLLVATWPMLAAAVVLSVAGTEIRVRVEDALLASRFGEAFAEYRRTVPAYVPYVR